jgi:hypothetical protein
MSLLGISFRMKIGEGRPETAKPELNEALQKVEVTHGDEGVSAFQLSFQIGRGRFDLDDYALVQNLSLRPFNRVQLIVYVGLTEHVLMDGIITDHEFSPSNEPGASTLTVTGSDVSLMMDLEERSQKRDNLDHKEIVRSIIKDPKYADYGFEPDIPPKLPKPTNPARDKDDGTNTQPNNMTDLRYIQDLAANYGFVTYVQSCKRQGLRPGTEEFFNKFYWGPPKREDVRQGVISFNMGPHTNTDSISFRFNSLAPKAVAFTCKDGERDPIRTSTLEPPLAKQITPPKLPRQLVFSGNSKDLPCSEAERLAQGQFDKSMQEVVTASGELDALRYGEILEPRRLVDVRGVGFSYDGSYYVKSVTHSIDVHGGTYRQSFSLTREGLGSLTRFIGL